MSELSTTAEERPSRVRATIAGTPFPGGAKQRAQGSRGQNLLVGAMLRAAERQDAGRELTGLEERLIGVLRAAVPDKEIGGVRPGLAGDGRTGCGDWLPTGFTARPADQGYAVADLVADLAAAGPEILAQPNVSVVNVTDLTAEGGSLDSQEFLAAVAEYASGATVVTGPKLPAGKEFGGPLHAKLELDVFHCVRSTGPTLGADPRRPDRRPRPRADRRAGQRGRAARPSRRLPIGDLQRKP